MNVRSVVCLVWLSVVVVVVEPPCDTTSRKRSHFLSTCPWYRISLQSKHCIWDLWFVTTTYARRPSHLVFWVVAYDRFDCISKLYWTEHRNRLQKIYYIAITKRNKTRTTITLWLYESATYSFCECEFQATPNGCCSFTSMPLPSWSPNAKRFWRRRKKKQQTIKQL